MIRENQLIKKHGGKMNNSIDLKTNLTAQAEKVLKVKKNHKNQLISYDVDTGLRITKIKIPYYQKQKAFVNNQKIILLNGYESTLTKNGYVQSMCIQRISESESDNYINNEKIISPDTKNTIPLMQLIHRSYKKKDQQLKINRTKWALLVRNIIRNKNTVLIGPTGCGKTSIALEAARAVNRPSFIFNLGSTQDPRSALIGQNQYSKEKGTYFQESDFIKALETKNSVIILDEISRAHPEVFNIILPILDFRKSFRIEESNRMVNIADNVAFVATANVGIEYTSTKIMDRALLDRFIPIELPFTNCESELIDERYPRLDSQIKKDIFNFIRALRDELESETPRITSFISTRMVLLIADMCNDGFLFYDVVAHTLLPQFNNDGDINSERSFVLQVLQKFASSNK